jgi:tetratricopeptide (TPR) repeat protein
MSRIAISAWFAALSWLAPLLVGCGGPPTSKVPESAQRLLDAKASIAAGDTAAALASLQASIDAEPTTWAYVERAKINAKQGNDQAALDDCDAILKLQPESTLVPWIRAELKKPAAKRFADGEEAPVVKK